MNRTTIQANIEIDADAWRRVCELASRSHRPLPVVIGDILERASLESAPEVANADRRYTAPLLVRLFLRRHPDAEPAED